jgi:hydroxymethylpyrimidine/phosphomethylpyrimidine kinase
LSRVHGRDFDSDLPRFQLRKLRLRLVAKNCSLAFNSPVRSRTKWPIALTIAGSDSGGGAGIQADLKTFAALKVHGTSAITCLTAQNPRRIRAIESSSAAMVREQMRAVFEELPPAAAKTGMLFSAEIIRVVAEWFREHQCALVVDPVMIATSGAELLKKDAVHAMTMDLLPLAKVITPNVPEAEALLGTKIREPEDLRSAARELFERHGCAALVKGGHLKAGNEAIDVFFDGRTELLLSTPRVRGVKTHGTGCTYSAAITALIARGKSLEQAVQGAKTFVANAIANSLRAASHDVLNFNPVD